MTFLSLQLSFLEFDVIVFKAILSIQRFFNLTEYREVIIKIHFPLGMQECRFEFEFNLLLNTEIIYRDQTLTKFVY